MTKVYYKHYISGCREINKKCKAILSLYLTRYSHGKNDFVEGSKIFLDSFRAFLFSAIHYSLKQSTIIITFKTM